MNNKQRARWLADMISEMQRYISKSQGQEEFSLVQKALNKLEDARRLLLATETTTNAE